LKTKGKKALLVGTNKYHDSKLNNLKFSVNDVSSIYDILTDPNRGGFTRDSCLLMTDRSRKTHLKPIRSNLMSSITSLSQTAKPDDYILFFFSGHGIEENEKSYLLPSDARINVLRDTAVSIDWIKTTLQASKAHSKVLILDACHAGAMKGKSESGRMTKGLHDSLFPATEGFAILSSCKLHEVSYEMPEKKHGVFSYFLTEGLQGAADFDSDGHIMVSDASRYTAEKTMEWSYKEGVQQTPNLESKVVGDLILVDVPRLEDKKVQAKIEKVEQDFSYLVAPVYSIRIGAFSSLGERDRDRVTARIVATLCPYLCKYFSLDEIRYTEKKYVFPLGDFSEEFPLMNLRYDLQEIARVEEILIECARIICPDAFVYYFSSPFDLGKISKLLKTTKWKTLRYDPKILQTKQELHGRGAPFLEVEGKLPDLKQKLKLRFVKKEGEARLIIETPEREKLDEESVEMLRPTKFLKLLGDIWKQK